MATDPLFPGAIGSASTQIAAAVVADTAVATGTSGGWMIGRITVSTDNNNGAFTVTVKRQPASGTIVKVGTFSVPDGAGVSLGVSPVDVLSQVFNDIPINLAVGEQLIFTKGALNTGKVMDVHIEYATLA